LNRFILLFNNDQKFNAVKKMPNWLLQQFQLKPGKPAIASSLRALVSVLAPLSIGVWLGNPAASAIAIIGAWFVGLVNVEGVYRQKATAKIVAAISMTAMVFLANLVHGTLWLSAVTMFLVMLLTGLVGLLGQAASAISVIVSLMFVVALAKFATFSNWTLLLQQCAFCLAGGAWSILLSVVIWRLRPYEPVIQSVARCYGALSQLVDSAKGRIAYPKDRRAQLTRFLTTQDDYMQALISARDRWSAAWTAQRSANQAGTQLLVLIEDTPVIANAVITLVEQVVISSDHSFFQPLQRAIQESTEQLALALQQLSVAIASGKSSVHLGDLDRAIEALQYQQKTLRTQLNQSLLPIQSHDHTALTSLNKIAATLARLANQVHADVESLSLLQRENASRTVKSIRYKASFPRMVLPKLPALSSILEPLRSNLTIHSVLFRHALRLAIVATIAEVIASLLQIPTGYWITLTAVIALKPNYGGTAQTAFQRVVGTVLGGIVGIGIVTLIHNVWIIGACLLFLIMAAVAVRPLSFSLFGALLTPAIILLLNLTSQGGWQIGVLRIADSLVGGLLALLGSYLLFPRWERQQLPAQLNTTLRANLVYFQQVIMLYLCSDEQEVSNDVIIASRRQAALENSNIAAAAQRLFSEPQHIQGDIEPITTLIFYIRRFFNSVTVLAEHHQELSEDYQCLDFRQFADTIVQVLENIMDALQHRKLLNPLPDLDRHLEAIHDHIEQLHTNRALNSGETPSQILQAVRERTPISSGLDQISYEIKRIHSAIARLQRQKH
jgi:uncharacterized membrane protein YccC